MHITKARWTNLIVHTAHIAQPRDFRIELDPQVH